MSASGTGDDWTWKDQVDMVKWTDRMIGHSLLGLEPSDLNKMALECFARFGHIFLCLPCLGKKIIDLLER